MNATSDLLIFPALIRAALTHQFVGAVRKTRLWPFRRNENRDDRNALLPLYDIDASGEAEALKIFQRGHCRPTGELASTLEEINSALGKDAAPPKRTSPKPREAAPRIAASGGGMTLNPEPAKT